MCRSQKCQYMKWSVVKILSVDKSVCRQALPRLKWLVAKCPWGEMTGAESVVVEMSVSRCLSVCM